MIQTPFAAFGYVVMRNQLGIGEVFNDELFTDGVYSVFKPSPFYDGRFGAINSGYTWVYTKGTMQHTNATTGHVQYRNAGFCNITTLETIGTTYAECTDAAEIFCVSPVVNKDKIPSVPVTAFFELAQGSTTTLPLGTKLFLCSGELQTSDTTLVGPRQITVSSGDVVVTATTNNCYGLLFP
jgi:hypothetical protein